MAYMFADIFAYIIGVRISIAQIKESRYGVIFKSDFFCLKITVFVQCLEVENPNFFPGRDRAIPIPFALNVCEKLHQIAHSVAYNGGWINLEK